VVQQVAELYGAVAVHVRVWGEPALVPGQERFKHLSPVLAFKALHVQGDTEEGSHLFCTGLVFISRTCFNASFVRRIPITHVQACDSMDLQKATSHADFEPAKYGVPHS
jgi:hypothetical protein